jgi:putative addiction module CopG family antidote
METLTISLSKAQREFIAEQMAAGGYRSVSAYFNALLKAERRRQAEEWLTRLVEEADASGPPTPMTRADWDNIREKALQRLAAEKAADGKNRKKAPSRK